MRQDQVCLEHTLQEQRTSDHGVNEAKRAEPCRIIFRNLTARHGRRGQDTTKCLDGVVDSYDILKKDHWADKKFLFFFDTPGKRAAYNGGTVHLHKTSNHDRKEPAKSSIHISESTTRRARVCGTQDDARTDGEVCPQL